MPFTAIEAGGMVKAIYSPFPSMVEATTSIHVCAATLMLPAAIGYGGLSLHLPVQVCGHCKSKMGSEHPFIPSTIQ